MKIHTSILFVGNKLDENDFHFQRRMNAMKFESFYQIFLFDFCQQFT